MKISIEVDVRFAVVTAGCALAGLFALHAAYPGLYGYWPKTSADLASWLQAIGAVAAIWWSGRLAGKQTQAAREQMSTQIEAARSQTISQIEAGREQAQVAHLQARKLVADQRRLDDLLKTEVLCALFEDALAYCQRIHEVHETSGVPNVEKYEYEHLKELGYVLRQLPAFELPGQFLAVVTIRITRDIDGICDLGLGLPSTRGGALYLDAVAELEGRLRDTTLMLEEAIRVCTEQIDELSILSTGARVN